MKTIKFTEEQMRQLDWAMDIAIEYYTTQEAPDGEMPKDAIAGEKRYRRLKSHIMKQSDWVNFDKTKPTLGRCILMYTKKKTYILAVYSSFYSSLITHWQNIPDSPL